MAKSSRSNTVTFKRLPIGAKFITTRPDLPGTFKKIGGKTVILMNPNGTGQTHRKINFPTGNTACVVQN